MLNVPIVSVHVSAMTGCQWRHALIMPGTASRCLHALIDRRRRSIEGRQEAKKPQYQT